MTDKIKIGIGAPTYNSVERLENLLTSIEFYTDPADRAQCRIVVLDDGTPDLKKREGVREFAKKFGVDFIQHEKNEGIPKSWNDLVRHFDSDIFVLFNDDICVCDPSWLKCTVYALEQNEKVGVIGFPLIQMDPRTKLPNKNYSPPNYDSAPGRVGACVGCSFAFKRRIFDDIGQFDENIYSFYEEIDWGFRLAKAGYYSIMLPFPPMEHYGSQSFGQNIEINLQIPDDRICSMQEYKEIMGKKYPPERIEPILGKPYVYRMDYSRVYFARKWGCKDMWDCPQGEVHNRLVTPLPKIKFRYLNKDLQEVECEI